MYLMLCSVQKKVNVEREGGGDGEGEVRGHGDHVHPGRPGELLRYPPRLPDGKVFDQQQWKNMVFMRKLVSPTGWFPRSPKGWGPGGCCDKSQ